MKFRTLLLLVMLGIPGVSAATFFEDFESYDVSSVNPENKPDQEWYNYRETRDIGNVTAEGAINGNQEFTTRALQTPIPTNHQTQFRLEIPAQIDSTTFWIKGESGTRQYVALQSISPVRAIVEFYVFCSTFCELRVRWETADTTGQVLVPQSESQTQFKIKVTPSWTTSEFCLEVDDVDDGCFSMLQLPNSFGRVLISQYQGDFPMGIHFDDWTVEGGIEGLAEESAGDWANGIINYANAVRFNTGVAGFIFGTILLIVMVLAIWLPMFYYGKSNAISTGASFVIILVVFWLVFTEIWPDWMVIAAIIAVAGIVGMFIRETFLGIKDASSGAGLVAGSLGYFIITTAFLGFAGYASTGISLPVDDQEIDVDDVANATENETVKQSFVEATIDCIVSGAVFTFGLKGNCSRNEESKQFKFLKSTVDNVGRFAATVFNYARNAVTFLFQLLTFQLPIPVIFNMMIVFPPAASLAAYAFELLTRRS